MAKPSPETAQEIDRLRAQLFDVAYELRPLSTFDELAERFGRIRDELHRIEQELQVVLHVARLEKDDILSQVEELDRRLAEGWVPESRAVDDVVADLRSKYR